MFASLKMPPSQIADQNVANPKPVNCFLNFPVNITAEGHLDELHFKMLWLNDGNSKSFVTWLRTNNVLGYVKETGTAIAPPKAFKDLEDDDTRNPYMEAWQKAYNATGIFYEPWLKQHSISRQLCKAIRPVKVHASSLTAIADKIIKPRKEECLSQKAAAAMSLPTQPSKMYPDKYAELHTDAANYHDSRPEELQDQLDRLYLEWNTTYPRFNS